MIKKIKEITKIFLIDYYQELNIINKKNKKINIKSIFTWLLLIVVICLTYLSLKGIQFCNNAGNPSLFFKIYLPIIAILMMVQLIIIISNVFYNSKDLENILSLPINPICILISKLNVIIIISYFMESIFLLIPLIMYGLIVARTISYFIFMFFIVAIFPIFYILLFGSIIIITMIFSKIIKNRDIYRIIITSILTFLLSFALTRNIENVLLQESDPNITTQETINIKLENINQNFIIINPAIKILTSSLFSIRIENALKIILINGIIFVPFILLGKKIYLKNILKNSNSIKIKNRKNKYKKNGIKKSYIKNEFKKILKDPTYFLQNIFYYLSIIILFSILLKLLLPVFINQIKTENIIEEIGVENFKLQATLIICGIVQIIFTFSNLSSTAISRDGKDAVFMKYIPLSLYEQFKLKSFPQILVNTIAILMILAVMYINEIKIYYYIITFILLMIINILNSNLMLLIDLKNVNLNWTSKESITQNNQNKIYQYVLTIIIILGLSYLSKIFEDIKFGITINAIILIFFIILILLNKYIKKHINKIFSKIY